MVRTRGTADALAHAAGGPTLALDGALGPQGYPCLLSDLGALTWRSEGSGEWPRGVGWTPGEVRTLPSTYPVTEAPPGWLVAVLS